MSPMESQEEPDFEALQTRISSELGLDCRLYKTNYLKRRLAVRMRAVGASTYGEYLRYLEKDRAEYTKLQDRITVNVTEFFRDAPAWEALAGQFLPALVAARKAEMPEGRRPAKSLVRAWSAGCSTGEEPYSLAISLLEAFSGTPWLVPDVLATDIDEVCLETAHQAVYESKSLAAVEPSRREAWFQWRGDKVQVKDAARQVVRFKPHNLMGDPPSGSFDLILCRNVMIYFSQDLHLKLFECFHRALHPGGYLMIGKTESVLGKPREFFTCVSARERIYQRNS